MIGNLWRGRECVDCSERGWKRGRGVDVEAGDECQADQGGEGHCGETPATEICVASFNISPPPFQIEPTACISTVVSVKD